MTGNYNDKGRAKDSRCDINCIHNLDGSRKLPRSHRQTTSNHEIVECQGKEEKTKFKSSVMVFLKDKISDHSTRLEDERKHHEDRKLDDADEDNGIQHNFD